MSTRRQRNERRENQNGKEKSRNPCTAIAYRIAMLQLLLKLQDSKDGFEASRGTALDYSKD